jgi:outer membrane receptor for monomeric catechols
MIGSYSVGSGSNYGDYHFRTIYAALLPSLTCYTSANGDYISTSITANASSNLPNTRKECSVSSSGKVDLTVDISTITGNYYVAAMLLTKACSAKGTLTIDALWLE